MSQFKIKGLDKLQKQLKNIERAAKELEKGENVSFDVLFNPSFMRKNTQFNTFEDFLTDGNFVVNSQEDFEAIPDKDIDDHVSKTTKFNNWQEMLDTAATEYTIKKLGF